MASTRDYLIATLMGENNRGTVESQQGVLDTIINRLASPTEYGAARGSGVQGIVLARTGGGGYQYDAWRPELNGKPNGQYALSSAALKGRDALSGAAQKQYDQAAQVVDDFMNKGVGRGITQGATFYQTPDAPNAWQRNALWPKYGQITVGDHIYSGPALVKDRAEYQRQNPSLFTSQQAPAFTQDGFGAIVDPSKGYNNGGAANFGDLAGLFQTLPYGTSPNSGPGDALGVGDGSLAAGILPDIFLSRPSDYGAIASLYQNNTGRSPEADGANYWIKQLDTGKNLFDIEQAIRGSAEGQAYLAQNPRDAIASQLIFPVGPGSTTGTIGPGATQNPVGPGAIASPVGGTGTEIRPVGPEGYETNVVGAPEASQTVKDIYETILARSPDEQGAAGYQGQIQRGISPSIVEAQVLASPEAKALPPDRYQGLVQNYQAKYGLLPQEVQTVAPLAEDFARVLGRPADSKTIQAWDQQIDAGTPLSLLEAQLIQAPEVQALGAPALSQLVNDYQTQYALKPQEVTALGPLASEFAKVVGRPADTKTLQYWDQQIDAGATLPQLNAQVLSAPETMALTGGVGDAYTAFQNQYGRSASDYLAALSDPTKFSGANVSGNVGNGTFAGTFNPSQYLAANPDVAASGMDPLAHFVKYGLSEGRALDTAGDRLPQGFDGTAYLAQNQDVARSGMNPLEHYLRFGAAEGRAAPTGSNPFSFTTANVSQGAGPVGNGTFSGTFNDANYFAANKDVAASGMSALDHYLRYGYGEGRAIDTLGDRISGFDGTAYLAQNRDVAMAGMDPLRHYLMSGAAEGRAAPTGSNNYSFSNFNVAGGLGNPGTGSFGLGGITSSAPGGMGSVSPAPTAGTDMSNPFGFSSANMGTYTPPGGGTSTGVASGGFNATNAVDGSGGGSGSAFYYKDKNGNPQIATFNPAGSENSYLAGQVGQNQQQIEAGRLSVANNPNLWNFGASNLLNSVAASNYQPAPIYSTATAQTAALAPTMPAPFNSPLPVMQQGLRVNPYGGFGLISAF